MPTNLRFWDEYDDKEIYKKWFSDFSSPWKEYIRRRIEKRHYESVLDYGAGLCSEYYGFIEDEYRIKYKAVDVTDFFVQEGVKKGIDIEKCDFDNLSFEDDSFDVCMCLDVINHQDDFEPILLESYRVCRHESIITFHKRFSDKDENVIEVKREKPYLIVNHFSKKKIEAFLLNRKIKFKWEYFFKDDTSRDMLILIKRSNGG